MSGQGCLLERDREIADLAAACKAASQGRGEVLAVRAPAGVGKTTLLREAQRLAGEAGIETLRASGTELERELAFGVVRQLFERPARRLITKEEHGELAGAAALAVPVVLDPATEPTGPEAAHAAMHGLYWLAVELASRRPLLLVIDDAHWADAPSLRWLAYLGRRLEGLPVLVVAAYRPGEPGADVALVEQALAEASARVIEPRPLSPGAIAAWIEKTYGTRPAPEFADACAAITGGNPFLVRELLASLRADAVGPDVEAARELATITPASIGRSVLPRLARMGADAVAVGEAAAVLSADARLDRIATVADVDVERTADIVGRLVEAGILSPGDALVYRHPLLRSAVYDQMPHARRDVAHLAAAQRLLDDGGGPERAASHLLRTTPGGRSWVAETLRSAAQAALGRGAPEAAVRLLRRARQEPPDDCAGVLVELTAAELAAGDLAAAVDSGRSAFAAANVPEQRIEAAILASRALVLAGRYGEALELLATAERELGHLDRDALLALRAVGLTVKVWKEGSAGIESELAELNDLGVDDVPGVTPAERWLVTLRAMVAISRGASRAQPVAIARRLVATHDPEVGGEDEVILTAARCLGIAGELDESYRTLSAVVDGARARGSSATAGLALSMRTECAYWAGRLDAAEADAREALRLAPDIGPWRGRDAAAAYLMHVLIERGRVAEALAIVDSRESLGAAATFYTPRLLLHARGRSRAIAGSSAEAAEDLRRCGAAQEAWGEKNPAIIPWRSELALVLNALGRRAEAVALADEEVGLAERFGVARTIGVARRVRALLMTGSEQVEGLRAAVEILDGGPARLELARALVDLGAALRRTGRRVEARETLARGLDEADRCGAHALAARARDELKAAGSRPRRARLSGAEALTASERRVAELAAEGLSNREVAQALFITVKTVEMHLGRVYMKLGIAGRSGLAEALGDRG